MSEPRAFTGIDEMAEHLGAYVGHSDWHTVTQKMIDDFAQSTGDDQWIHVDSVKAQAGPFGSTIAHGYLTLALVSKLTWETYSVEAVTTQINYGVESVRFPAPLHVDSRVQADVQLIDLQALGAGHLLTSRVTLRKPRQSRPVCVATTLTYLVAA